MKKCKLCNKELKNWQKKYCSRNCANKGNSEQNSESKKGKNNPMYGKVAWNKGIPRTLEQKLEHSTKMKESYKTKTKKGFQKGNKTKTQYRKGHTSLYKGKKMSKEFCKKVTEGKLKSEYKHSLETKIKQKKQKLGSKNFNWRGGVTLENRSRFNTLEWRGVTKKCRERDNYTCQKCNKKRSIEVHHIIPWRITKDDSLDNLVTLCKSCHLKIEIKLNKKYYERTKK